jgi:heterodisulfide reductase subunit A-like polyferredoxin
MKQPLEHILSTAQTNGGHSHADDVSNVNGIYEEPAGLRILIVGAGIGGLTAAIALRKQGHEVLVSFYFPRFLGELSDAKSRFSNKASLPVSSGLRFILLRTRMGF